MCIKSIEAFHILTGNLVIASFHLLFLAPLSRVFNTKIKLRLKYLSQRLLLYAQTLIQKLYIVLCLFFPVFFKVRAFFLYWCTYSQTNNIGAIVRILSSQSNKSVRLQLQRSINKIEAGTGKVKSQGNPGASLCAGNNNSCWSAPSNEA